MIDSDSILIICVQGNNICAVYYCTTPKVDGVREHSGSLGHQKTADFEGRFSLIIKLGMRENPIPDNAILRIKRGRKKSSRRRKTSLTVARSSRWRFCRSCTIFPSPFRRTRLSGISGWSNCSRKFQVRSEVKTVLPHFVGQGISLNGQEE